VSKATELKPTIGNGFRETEFGESQIGLGLFNEVGYSHTSISAINQFFIYFFISKAHYLWLPRLPVIQISIFSTPLK
jgi:hypothetical protein